MWPLEHWEGGSKTELPQEGLCGRGWTLTDGSTSGSRDLWPTQTTESHADVLRPRSLPTITMCTDTIKCQIMLLPGMM